MIITPTRGLVFPHMHEWNRAVHAVNLKWNGTNLLKTDIGGGVLDLVQDCGENGACPESSPTMPFSSCVISGYSDGFFNTSNCTECADDDLPPWDGTFGNYTGDPGADGAAFSAAGDDDLSISGKTLKSGSNVGWFSSTFPFCWQLDIGCVGTGNDFIEIWKGYKAGGSTLKGTYTRSAGCDLTPTVTIA